MSKKIDLEALKKQPRHHESFIKAYLEYTRNLEAPTEYHVWTALSVIAGALRGKCYIDMGHFKWKPNQFIIFVAPPGVVAKSTTSGVGMDLLRDVPGINFGPTSCTWQALLGSLQENEETFMIEGKKKMMSCLTLEASELGTFLNFQDTEMIDVIVDLWDGKDRPVVRRTQGGGQQEIQSPWINLIAATTPSWIAQSMPRYAIGGGFTSRCVFVYADTKAKLIAYPGDNMDKGAAHKKRRLVEDLTKISQLSGAFTLSPEAKQFGIGWYEDFNNNKPSHLKDEQLAGYAARKQTHMHKIAMCLCAARGDSQVIEKVDLERALSLLASSEKNMLKVFNSITDDKDAKALQVIKLKLLESKRGIDQFDMFTELSSRMSWQQFKNAVDGAVLAGFAKSTNSRNGVMLSATKKLRDDMTVSMSDIDKQMMQEIKEGGA